MSAKVWECIEKIKKRNDGSCGELHRPRFNCTVVYEDASLTDSCRAAAAAVSDRKIHAVIAAAAFSSSNFSSVCLSMPVYDSAPLVIEFIL